jgi:hypothetical protein
VTAQRLLVDTGVIWSFAAADALDVLTLAGGGSVDAPEAVRVELGLNVRTEPMLAKALTHSKITWVDLEVELGERGAALNTAIEGIRSTFVRPGDSAFKHLGESHILLLAERIPDRWTVCFEDRDARRFADAKSLPLKTTFDLLRDAFDAGAKCDDVLRLYAMMLACGRRLPVGMSHEDLCTS